MQSDAIYKGATRPPMLMGIPLVPLVALFGSAMLLAMWGGTLFGWWIAVAVLLALMPALLWMRFVTARDDQRFRQVFLYARLCLLDQNRNLWHARSYAPNLYRGASDAWHA